MRLATIAILTLSIILLSCSVVYASVLGIDLSSDNIKVSAVRSGVPFHIVVDEQAKRKVPLAISFDGGERHFGNNAVGFTIRKPLDTYLFAHRLLGQTLDSARVSDMKLSFGYNFVEIPDRGGSVGIQSPQGIIYSPEELIAMSLQHIAKIAREDGNDDVRDVVITVPWWYTSNEKRALYDAATLADLNILSLVTNNAASSITYGIDRVYNNDTLQNGHYMIMIDIGASGAELSLIQYTGTKQRNGKIAGFSTLLASVSDDSIGGHYIDRIVRDYFISILQKQLESNKSSTININDILSNPRSMAKLLKQAQATKTVLSANKEMKVRLENVYPNVDLSTILTRDEFDILLQPLLQRLEILCQSLYTTFPSHITPELVNDVVIVGGTVRIPIIQNTLKQSLNVTNLSQTINGDESMTMGAVFIAANYSATFQTKPFYLTDTHNSDVQLHIYDDVVPYTDDNTTDNINDDDYHVKNNGYYTLHAINNSTNSNNNNDNTTVFPNDNNRGKSVTLFAKNSPLNKRKTITLTRNTNILLSLDHNISHIAHNNHPVITGYYISNITQTAQQIYTNDQNNLKRELELGLVRNTTSTTSATTAAASTTTEQQNDDAAAAATTQQPRVKVALTFNTLHGITTSLVHAEAIVEEWVIVDMAEENAKKIKKAQSDFERKEKLAQAKAKASAAKAAAEAAKDENADNTENKTSDDNTQDTTDKTTTATATTTDTPIEPPAQFVIPDELANLPLHRLEKRYRRIPLPYTTLPFVHVSTLPRNVYQLSPTYIGVSGFMPLTSEQLDSSLKLLTSMNNIDIARRQLSESRNTLESIIYNVKYGIEDDNIISITNDTQRDELLTLSTTLNEWLDYSDDATTILPATYTNNNDKIEWYNKQTDVYINKTKPLQVLWSNVQKRLYEKQELPSTIERITTGIALFRNLTNTYRNERPWILDKIEVIDVSINDYETKVNTLLEQQNALNPWDTPILSSDDILHELGQIAQQIKKVAAIKAPKGQATSKPTKQQEGEQDGGNGDAADDDDKTTTDQDTKQNDNNDTPQDDDQQQQQSGDEQQQQQQQDGDDTNNTSKPNDSDDQQQDKDSNTRPLHDEL